MDYPHFIILSPEMRTARSLKVFTLSELKNYIHKKCDDLWENWVVDIDDGHSFQIVTGIFSRLNRVYRWQL